MTSQADDFLTHARRIYSDPLEPPIVDLDAVCRGARRRKARKRITIAGAGALAVVGGLVVTQLHDSSNTSLGVVEQPPASEYFASATAEDWVRHATAVVAVNVVAEDQGESAVPSPGPRNVELAVTERLWEWGGGPPVDDSIELEAVGFSTSGGELHKVAYPGVPRLEVGHRYVIALAWVPARCAAGDKTSVAHWMPLGSHALVPFDQDRIGVGESEGRAVSADPSQSRPGSLERQLAGAGTEELSELLAEAALETPPLGPTFQSPGSCTP